MSQPISFGPVPANWIVGDGLIDGRPSVVLEIRHRGGQCHHSSDSKFMRQIAELIIASCDKVDSQAPGGGDLLVPPRGLILPPGVTLQPRRPPPVVDPKDLPAELTEQDQADIDMLLRDQPEEPQE